jgi:hypothetical protein
MSGTNDRDSKWAGGYIRSLGSGPTARRVFFIRKMVAGTRYEISTQRANEIDALLELQKFARSPATYTPTPLPDLLGDEGPSPVWLSSDLIDEHLKYCTAMGTSHQWWNAKRRILEWWLEALYGIDLRNVDLRQHILAPLKGATSRQHRIATIKAFYAWLRDADGGKGILTAAEDPTLGNRPSIHSLAIAALSLPTQSEFLVPCRSTRHGWRVARDACAATS